MVAGHLGGPAVELERLHDPGDQGSSPALGSPVEPASPLPASLPLSLSVSLMNKDIKSLKNFRLTYRYLYTLWVVGTQQIVTVLCACVCYTSTKSDPLLEEIIERM